jgi:hypothetical protein
VARVDLRCQHPGGVGERDITRHDLPPAAVASSELLLLDGVPVKEVSGRGVVGCRRS